MKILQNILATIFLATKVLGSGDGIISSTGPQNEQQLTIQKSCGEHMSTLTVIDRPALKGCFQSLDTRMGILDYLTMEEVQNWIYAFAGGVPAEKQTEFIRDIKIEFFGENYPREHIIRISPLIVTPLSKLREEFTKFYDFWSQLSQFSHQTNDLFYFIDDLPINSKDQKDLKAFGYLYLIYERSVNLKDKYMINLLKDLGKEYNPELKKGLRLIMSDQQERGCHRLDAATELAEFGPEYYPEIAQGLVSIIDNLNPDVFDSWDRLNAVRTIKDVGGEMYHPKVISSLYSIMFDKRSPCDLQLWAAKELKAFVQSYDPENVQNHYPAIAEVLVSLMRSQGSMLHTSINAAMELKMLNLNFYNQEHDERLSSFHEELCFRYDISDEETPEYIRNAIVSLSPQPVQN